mgnify:FL=1
MVVVYQWVMFVFYVKVFKLLTVICKIYLHNIGFACLKIYI